MKIIHPSFVIMDPQSFQQGVDKLRIIERQARISHRSEDKQGDDTWHRFITAVVLEHGDWSVVEHATATVEFRVDRGVTHELVRHRLFSFTQESTRFVNYGKKEIEFVEPAWNPGINEDAKTVWRMHMEDASKDYNFMLKNGASPQIARSVLPNATASTIVVTGNLRNWRHFFMMRTTIETHPDFKRVTIPLLSEFKQRIPLLYSDIEPDVRQVTSMAKAK